MEYRKAIVMQNGITVQDLVDICKRNNLPISTRISAMGVDGHILVNIASNNEYITLDEENLVCNECNCNCDHCPHREDNNNRRWVNVNLSQESAVEFHKELRNKGIRYESSGCGHLVHFEVYASDEESTQLNDFLSNLDK